MRIFLRNKNACEIPKKNNHIYNIFRPVFIWRLWRRTSYWQAWQNECLRGVFIIFPAHPFEEFGAIRM